MAHDQELVVGLAGDCLIQHRVSAYRPYGTKVEIRDGMGVVPA